MSDVIKYAPAVFAVGRDYKILIPVNKESVMWVRVGNECYYDDANGVLRSSVAIHKVTVPCEVLDHAKKYTVCYREMIERKPYFSVTGEIVEITYDFYPLCKSRYNIFHIADAHGMVEAPVSAADTFRREYGEIDLLILNGDVIDHSGDFKNFDAIYNIAARITGGEHAVVFSRGNHDTRGVYAENIVDYTPTRDGYSYFSFRLGDLWGLVLDCGEDKDDSHAEYGNTNCCHAFRKIENRYLESIIENAENEYAAEGVCHRIVIAHSPFTTRFAPPFNIEEDIYAHWTGLISDNIKPDFLLCGHTHKASIYLPGSEKDAYGQSFPTIVAAEPKRSIGYYIGGGFAVRENEITFVLCDDKSIKEEHSM